MRVPDQAATSGAAPLGIRAPAKGLRESPDSLEKTPPVVHLARSYVSTHDIQNSSYRYELRRTSKIFSTGFLVVKA